MQQPTSGVTLKSYVSGFNCSWMNGKASKLLPLPPYLPPPGTWSKHHTLLWVAPQTQPWPPPQPLCARGRRGSPYPFLIDTHTEWRWPTPDSPPPPVLWHCYFENVTPQMWVTLSAFFGIHMCHRTHVNRRGCAQSRLCAEDNTDASRQQCVVRRMKAAASLMGGGSAWRRGWGEMSKGWGGLTCHSQQMLCCSISLHPVSCIHKH